MNDLKDPKNVTIELLRHQLDLADETERKLRHSLKAMPQIVYETLLEATAWMGIPEKKRENFIKERWKNVKFIVDKALEDSRPERND